MPIITPDLPSDDPYANIMNSSELRYKFDPVFKRNCDVNALRNVYEHQQREYGRLTDCLDNIPKEFHDIPFEDIIENATPVHAISESTRGML